MSEENKNPHYVTPEEAKKKTCPMIQYENCWCAGPECMAWRWAVDYYDKEIETPQGVMPSTAKRYSTTHGYCGMVHNG